MIEVSVNLSCDVCQQKFLETPWEEREVDDAMRLLMLTAELAGWKVYRFARDIYYGKAWCVQCRKNL